MKMQVTVEPQKIIDVFDPKRAENGQNGGVAQGSRLFVCKFDPTVPQIHENDGVPTKILEICLPVTEK